ncbi:MAG: hypothetical protein ACYDBJ_06110 [Aggregatilineales bacterium]
MKKGYPMNAITLTVEIPADHHLELDLPEELPAGAAQITIQSQSLPGAAVVNPAREAARAKLLAAGRLVTGIHAPPGAVLLSNEELEHLGQLAPGARSSEAMLDDERGPY